MNFHLNTVTEQRKKPKREDFPVSLAAKLIIWGIVVFLAVIYRIALNQQMEQMNRRVNKLQKKIDRIEKETANLRMKKEQLSGRKFIIKKIRAWNLRLRLPAPGQVASLTGIKNRFYPSDG